MIGSPRGMYSVFILIPAILFIYPVISPFLTPMLSEDYMYVQ